MNNLLEKTLSLLSVSKDTIGFISKSVGVSPRWIYKLKNAEVKDPSVVKVQALYDFLVNR